MRTLSFLLVLLISACLLHGCKERYQYDKYGMQRMSGPHTWHAAFQRHYHNGSVVIDSTHALPDTSFLIAILNKEIVEVGGIRLNILDEYTTSGTIIFMNDTGSYCGPSCRKVTLYYNYNANTVNLVSGVFNINGVDDTMTNYTTAGR